MEALAAIGLATNIITFVEFAATLLKGAKELSSRGSLSELDRIQDGTIGLQRFIAQLAAPSGVPATGTTKELDKLAAECAALADEMMKVLKKITNIKGQSSSRIDHLRISWRALLKKGNLESIQNRIDACRGSILEQIAFMIRQDQASLSKLTEEIGKRQEENSEQSGKQLESLRRELIAALDRSKDSTIQDQSDVTRLLQGVKSELERLISADSESQRVKAVLDKLWFDDMLSREASVNDPSGESYRWVLEPPAECSVTLDLGEEESEEKESEEEDPEEIVSKENVEREEARNNFNRWLKFESGLFYISGKPGSGKSTLMKFLAQDNHTQHQLQNWAATASRKPVLVKFFFWISGSPLQRSIEGLYRAILWEILTQCPDLIPNVLPVRWKDSENHESRISHVPLSLSEAREAFGLLQKSLVARHAVCIFIDGLDEFDGDHWRLGNDLASWKSEYVKICVSARPYNGFQKTLPLDPSRHFQLQKLNRGDMQEHTRSELLKDERFCQLQNQDTSSTQKLVKTLAEQAEGVFLWTVLAIKFILQGLTSQYSADQLLEMLSNDIPKDLEAMFLQMFERIPQPEQRQAAISLIMVSDPLMAKFIHPTLMPSLIFHWYIEQTMQDMALDDAGQVVKTCRLNLQQSPRADIEAAKTRLNSRCAGFISWTDDEYLFQITHRTLSDFLQQPSTKSRLRLLSRDVDLYLLLSKTCLNIVGDFGVAQTQLHSAWPMFWETVDIVVNIAEQSGDDLEYIDKVVLYMFDLRRTDPSICVRTDLVGLLADSAYAFNCYRDAWYLRRGHRLRMDIEYDVGLVQLLYRLITYENWNFVARTKKQLAGFIPETAKTVLILATAFSALYNHPTDQQLKGASGFAECLFETGIDLSRQVPVGAYIDGKYGIDLWIDTESKSRIRLFGSSPSIWELLLLIVSIEILSNPKASCAKGFKMIELCLKYGATQDMWLLVGRVQTVASSEPRFILPSRLHRISLQQLVEVRRPPNSDEIWRHLPKAKGSFGSLGHPNISCLTNEELDDPLVPLMVMDSHRLADLGNDISFAYEKKMGDKSFLAFEEEAGNSDVALELFRIRFS
ncbi:hypothetical protein PG984_011896 [Apiospora sp. TS-2023a]